MSIGGPEETEAAAERRRALGIPTHGDTEHRWRSDGYCNCGAEKDPKGTVKRHSLRESGVRPKSNLDYVEGNGGGR